MPTVKEYQELIAGGCPHCGEALQIKRGKYGEFIACSEWCGYTKSILGRSEYPPPKAIKRPCPYKKCDGSGLIPFEKAGKIIPHVHTFCDCDPNYGIETREHYREVRPEDFDFPISYSFYRSLCREHGWQDPGSDYPDEPVKELEPPREVIYRYSNLSKQEWDLFQQTALRAIHLEKRLNELSKPKKKPEQKYGYRGIR